MLNRPLTALRSRGPIAETFLSRAVAKLVVFSTLIALFSNPVLSADTSGPMVTVAHYRAEDSDTVGSRAHAILREHHISSIGVALNPAGVWINVPEERSREALQLLAEAIKAEGLHISLWNSKSHAVISPDSILSPKPSP